jgi:hypothetical protein
VLETLGPLLFLLVILLILPICILVGRRGLEGLAEADALEECMLRVHVHRALFAQDLLELVLLVP